MRLLSLLTALLLFTTATLAGDQPWLDEFPTPDKVVAAIKSANKNDAAAQQVAALDYVSSLALYMGGATNKLGATPTRELTAQEKTLTGSYTTKAEQIRQAALKSIDGDFKGTPLPSDAAFTAPMKRYAADGRFQSAIYNAVMLKTWRDSYGPTLLQKEKDRVQREKDEAAAKVAADRKAAADKAAADKAKLLADRQAAADKLAADRKAAADKVAADKAEAQAKKDEEARQKAAAEAERTRIAQTPEVPPTFATADKPSFSSQPWLEEFPSADRVLAEIKGADHIDTPARQQAALFILTRFHAQLAIANGQDPNVQSDATNYVIKPYITATQWLDQSTMRRLDGLLTDQQRTSMAPASKPSNKYTTLAQQLHSDTALDSQVRKQFFSDAFLAKWMGTITKFQQDQQAKQAAAFKAQQDKVESSKTAGKIANAALFIPIAGVLGALGVFGILRGWRRPRLGSPDLLDLESSRFRLSSIAGLMHGQRDRTSTHTHVSTSTNVSSSPYVPSSTSTNVSVSTTHHKSFFLRGHDGKEYPFQTTDWDVPMDEGQIMTAVWYHKRKDTGVDQGGQTMMLINHASDLHYTKQPLIRYIVKPNKWPVLAICGGCAALDHALGIGLFTMLGVLFFIAYFIVRLFAIRSRMKEFIGTFCPAIHTELSRRLSGPLVEAKNDIPALQQ